MCKKDGFYGNNTKMLGMGKEVSSYCNNGAVSLVFQGMDYIDYLVSHIHYINCCGLYLSWEKKMRIIDDVQKKGIKLLDWFRGNTIKWMIRLVVMSDLVVILSICLWHEKVFLLSLACLFVIHAIAINVILDKK